MLLDAPVMSTEDMMDLLIYRRVIFALNAGFRERQVPDDRVHVGPIMRH
jgi:hypothetical protein